MIEKLNVIQTMMALLGASAVAITALEGVLIGRLAKRDQGQASERQPYDWSAFWVTVRINMWRVLVEAIPMGVVLGASLPFGQWMYEQRLWTVPMDAWWGWAAMFLCTEFFYYWMHRAGHRVRWYWASHQVHHSGNQYNLAAAFRQSITGKVTGGFVFFAPQCLLGFSPDAVLISYGLNLVYQFWIHTDLVPKLGWMEGVFNTPSAHRVHHAANVEYLDCNYGGTIMLFDRLFGTYVEEQDGVPIRYGLVKPQTSRNALWVCLAEWAAIGRDLLKVRNPLHALGYLFGPPGWAPHGRGLTTEGLRQAMTGLTGQPAGVPPEWLLEGQPAPVGEAAVAPAAAGSPQSMAFTAGAQARRV
ncbi:sterol desaturase/sphingolipid hydroxylase (fatty acid hydroxylase superfamily) [Aquabacterium commune]|uniref:Sterol desaturase/sphingolipid hydroxylase (Fatty acid hydroxylase superfamily) n=1 Tax=Aquabacterium commune TaxID=70586 RepID=A0A4R6RAG9_9BURK|nr:sterol desaturase family protein [Aquabacterium commune]TDP82905.1 sterol desaturase/sphingolipid hydroxylase (fatty acid hydroxylase superfamily) [Aquabacterium commune]